MGKRIEVNHITRALKEVMIMCRAPMNLSSGREGIALDDEHLFEGRHCFERPT
jgi:hypothetical protein